MRKTVVVFYIGGVSYLEVAAFRHLSEKRTCRWVCRGVRVSCTIV